MKERWKAIRGYEGVYEISDLGNCRSISRMVTLFNRWGQLSERRKQGQMRSKVRDKDGYLEVILSVGGKKQHGKLHRLVAQHFVPNPNRLREINHLDLDKANNRFDNLQWSTRKENQCHARDAGRFHAASNPKRAKKLSEKQVSTIRRLWGEGFDRYEIAERYDIRPGSVAAIAARKYRVPASEKAPC